MVDKKKLDTTAIRRNVLKYMLLKALFPEEARCQDHNCELKADLAWLPCLELHHLNPAKKEMAFSKLNLSFKNFNQKLEIMQKEGLTIICKNCHIRKHSTTFNQFKEFILQKDLFELTPLEIENKINGMLSSLIQRGQIIGQKSLKYEIKRWIRKRSVIEQVYNGKCVGCGVVNVQNNLPALTFHHLDPSIKESEISEAFKVKNISELIEIIYKEKAICLCADCHIMVNATKLNKLYPSIFNQLSQDINYKGAKYYSQKTHDIYNNLFYNIRNFKFPPNNYIDHLNIPFLEASGDLWKKYLIHAYIISDKGKNSFTKSDLLYSLNIASKEGYRPPLQALLKYGFLTIEDPSSYAYKYWVTKKGVEKVTKVLMNIKLQSEEDYQTILNEIKIKDVIDFKTIHKDLRGFTHHFIPQGDAWKRYLIHIFQIIKEKGNNLVKATELYDSIGVSAPISNIHSPFKTLVERGYSTSTLRGRDNIIELTEKGKIFSNELSKDIQSKISNAKLSDDIKVKIDISSLKISGLYVYLLHIYLTIKRKKKNEFSPVNIASSLGIKRIRISLQQELIDNKFIELVRLKGRSKIFRLTEKGRNKVFELIKKYKLSF